MTIDKRCFGRQSVNLVAVNLVAVNLVDSAIQPGRRRGRGHRHFLPAAYPAAPCLANIGTVRPDDLTVSQYWINPSRNSWSLKWNSNFGAEFRRWDVIRHPTRLAAWWMGNRPDRRQFDLSRRQVRIRA
jgi:hypothetical protein